MSLIVSPSAGVDWTLTRERLCDKALEKCGELDPTEAARPEDRALCIEALDAILKNLLWRGYAWPKTLSSRATLTLTAATPNISLPADFYNLNALNFLDSGNNEIELCKMDFREYSLIPKKTQAADYPSHFYIDNFNKVWLWPVQSANVTAYLYYQQVIADTSPGSSVDLDSPWMLGIPYAIAAEIGDELGVPTEKIARFTVKWEQQLNLGVMNEGPPSTPCVSVVD